MTACVLDENTGRSRPMRPGEAYPPLPAEARDLIRVVFRTWRAEQQARAGRGGCREVAG
jgi:hypothetical protein